jgi:hypothetical protein
MNWAKYMAAVLRATLGGVGLLLLLGAGAQATTITVTDVELFSSDYTVGIQAPGHSENAYLSALIFTIDGKQVLVNCDDLWHNITLGPQTLIFTVESFSSLSQAPNPSGGFYSATQIGQMSWLLDQSTLIYSSQQAPKAGTTIAQDLAALQLASWKIGNPGATFTPSSQVITDLANFYIGESVGKGPLPGTEVVQFLSLNGVQSQLFDPVAVPEPAPWTMLVVGMLGLGFLKLRRASWMPAK